MGGERRVWDCCICHCAGGKLVAAMMGNRSCMHYARFACDCP